MNCCKLVLLTVGLANKWKEEWNSRDLDKLMFFSDQQMVLAKLQKEELFEELREVYAKVQHMIKHHSHNRLLTNEVQLLKELYLEFTVDLLLDIEQSLSTNLLLQTENEEPNGDEESPEAERRAELRRELRRLEKACPSRGVLEEHKERLKELISWYKIQKIRHMTYTLSSIYYEEIYSTIKEGLTSLSSQFANYFNQNIIFRLFPEFGRF